MSKSAEGHEHHSYVPGMGHDGLPSFLRGLLGTGRFHGRLLDQADIRPGDGVLEIGCGAGDLSILAARRHWEAEVVGLDPDPDALVRAARKARREGLSVRFDCGFAEELPYPDASFDHVLSAFMLHHLGPEAKRRALREVRRVLKPRGSLHLLDLERAKKPSQGLMGGISRLFHRKARPAHRHHLPPENFENRIPELMREAGLADSKEVDHRETRSMGSLTYYQATATGAVS